jgi:hypothetical protein
MLDDILDKSDDVVTPEKKILLSGSLKAKAKKA